MLFNLAFLSSPIFAIPLMDKMSGFRHQILRTQILKPIYWLSNMIVNAIVFTFSIIPIYLVPFIMQHEMLNVQTILMLFYGFSTMYYLPVVISFIRVKSDVILFVHMFLAIILMVCSELVNSIQSTDLQDILKTVIDVIGILTCPIYTVNEIGSDDKNDKTLLIVSFCVWNTLIWVYILISETALFNWLCNMIYQKVTSLWYKTQGQENEEESEQNIENEEGQENEEEPEQNIESDLALNVHKINRHFGKLHAVNDLSFQVKSKECVALLGVNGAGKTTTFNLITGKLYANSGEITICGKNVAKQPLVGYCGQFDELNEHLTANELLVFLAKLVGLNNANNVVNTLLNYLDLKEKANSLISGFSGGQKRRLSIGVALLMKAELLVLDEATAGVDPISRQKIWELLKAVNKDKSAILLTSHNMTECETLAHRICFMKKGKLEYSGTSQELKNKFGNGYLLSFTLANPNETTSYALNQIVTREFSTSDTKDSPLTSTQHWIISNEDQTLSSLFRKAQQIANSHPVIESMTINNENPQIKDFVLTQTSLEQTFLQLANESQSIN